MIDRNGWPTDNGPGLNKDSHHSIKSSLMQTQEIEERLWDYIDGLSSVGEKSEIEQLIATNREWQIRYRELLAAHELLNASELDAPSMRFTKNVMEEIARHHVAPATRTYINKNIIRSIGAFFLLMIAGFFVFVLGQFHWSGYTTAPSSPGIIAQYGTSLSNNLTNNIDKFNWGKVLSNTYVNIFIMVNTVLGLFLLDMYLQRRKEKAKINL
jgi:hypothetical protein